MLEVRLSARFSLLICIDYWQVDDGIKESRDKLTDCIDCHVV